MTVGVLLAVPLAFGIFGGSAQLMTLPPENFEILGGHNALWAAGLFFPTFFLLLSESTIYQKFFTAKDEQTARNAVIGMVVGVVILETALACIAIFGSSVYSTQAPFMGPDGTLNKAATETILLHIARFDLPMWSGVLLLCAAVAIILSTANSFLMITSTNITRDLYQRFINPDV
jgi:SSS family solute:Na+ symporter/sodium/proline symporter